ncbi:fatty acid desaturase [Sneathiella chinensis]|nr:fatty acid desaturase [Sneathiella chinensis]
MLSTPVSDAEISREQAKQWSQTAKQFAKPQTTKSILQLVYTLVPLIGLWVAMLLLVDKALWLTLLLAIPAAAFTVRLFIIQHDCGHHSYFHSRKMNDILGTLIGMITLTPHNYWRRSHNIHHATCGDLGKRGIGDIQLLTVEEYKNLSFWKRVGYRLYRNPLVFLGIGPIYLFVIKYRFPFDMIRREPQLLAGIMLTNVGIVGTIVALGLGFGFKEVFLVQGPIVLLSSAIGVWLFFVQHQFERTYWRAGKEWEFREASLLASSFYDLPQPLRWLSGNIGIHHIHHLSCRIPSYRLGQCLSALPRLKSLNRIGFWESLACFRLALWDDAAGRLVSFRSLRRGA